MAILPTSLETTKWAREHGLVLFVLSDHSSHLLQPLDVAIFGPFKQHYYSECLQFLSRHMGQNITKYNICTLACRAYLKALTPANIQSGFCKTGIYLLKTDVNQPEKMWKISGKGSCKKVKAIKAGPEAVKKIWMIRKSRFGKLQSRKIMTVIVLIRWKGAYLRDQMLVSKDRQEPKTFHQWFTDEHWHTGFTSWKRPLIVRLWRRQW